MARHREQAMAVKRAVLAAIVGQFGHPQGTAGSVAGWVMAHRPSNRHEPAGRGRREALDWLLITGERHLGRVLTEYVEHYNVARPHRSLGLRVPLGSGEPGQPIGEVVRRSRLGGLLREYSREAA